MTSTERELPAAASPGGAIGPELERLLQGQLRRLRLRFLWHGLGATVALLLAAVLLAFLLDHTLRLPAPIRLLHTAAIAGLAGYGLWHFVRRPLLLPLQSLDVAVLLERQFPDLHQRLVSALQLQRSRAHGELRNQSEAMIAALQAETAAAVAQLPLERLLTARATARLWAAGSGLGLLLALGAVLAPATAWAFALRQLGLAVSYPRATTLILEVPPASANLQRQDRPGEVLLTIPAGADLAVIVRAEGRAPDEVFLDVTGQGGSEHSVGMLPRPNGQYRYVFHPVKGDMTFHARGGDDDSGDKLVSVHVVHPPAVAQIRAVVQPPAYTGEAEQVQTGGPIEALAGSQVTLRVTATAAVTAATLVFLESGRRLPLQATTIDDDSGRSAAYGGGFAIDASDRYQVELVGDGGLRSPVPGTYPINVLPDYAPVGRWLQPDDEAPLLLAGAVLCVRLEVRDDHGLSAAALHVASSGQQREFALLPPPAAGAAMPKQLLATRLYEVKDLLQGQKPGLDGLSLEAVLTDNCVPQAGVTTLPRRSVQIVDSGQLDAAIARHFRSLREEIERSLSLQGDRRARTEELLQAGRDAGTPQLLTAIEVGQGRIQQSAQQAHRQLMRAFDLHLWNRLDQAPPAAAVLQLYLDWFQQHDDPRPYAPEFYRDLQQRRAAGSLGAMETTLDPILAMVGAADELANELTPKCLRLLGEAQVAKDAADLTDRLRQIVEVQAGIEALLQQLLARLDEWNDYQDLIQETRALRDRQKEVQGRTEELRGSK